MGIGLLVAGLILFLGVHSLPITGKIRAGLRSRLGEGGYKALFSLLSLAGLALIVLGYAQARAEGAPVLYDPPIWLRHVTMLLMVPVFVLLLAAYLPGRIKAKVRHPMIVAIKIWALSHLLANGDVASALLFLAFLAWAVVDRVSLKRRGGIPALAPGSAAARNDSIAIVGGLAIYGLFLWKLHGWLIGVPLV
ncbi:NnrU family protein [Stappia albiluteola]|uniref:NnrU family protein n=1 Tax=Stappia albiluteola TaxID=2758565 RepID=UPI001AD8BFD1|nr:NnrU family protein [Stappia albiluteola]